MIPHSRESSIVIKFCDIDVLEHYPPNVFLQWIAAEGVSASTEPSIDVCS